MVTGGIFALLDNAPYGAYAVDVRQVICYWNAAAERMLGHAAADVLGRRCYEVLQSIPVQGSSPFCVEDCPTIRNGLQGGIPQVVTLQLRCATGQTKRVHFTPLFLPQLQNDPKLLVFLFHDDVESGQASEAKDNGAERARNTAGARADATRGEVEPLTVREREVVRLLALGRTTLEMAEELYLSENTVRNHVSNARQKLRARSKLEAVLVAQQQGLI